jgi:hypothetical protein
MTRVGEAHSSIFLARLALLALSQYDEIETAKKLIDDAATEAAVSNEDI